MKNIAVENVPSVPHADFANIVDVEFSPIVFPKGYDQRWAQIVVVNVKHGNHILVGRCDDANIFDNAILFYAK